MSWRTAVRRAPLAVLFISAICWLSACQGVDHDGDASGIAVFFDGRWEGTWSASSTGASGLLTLDLDQVGASATGTAVFDGHGCLGVCNVACQANAHELSKFLEHGPMKVMFSGSCPESTHCSGPHHANTLTATYEIQMGPCSSEVGTIELTPIPPEGLDGGEPGAGYAGEVILVDEANNEVHWLPLFRRRGFLATAASGVPRADIEEAHQP